MKYTITFSQKILISLFLMTCSVAGFMVKLPGVFQHHDRALHAMYYFGAAAFFTLLFAGKNFWIHLFILIALALFGVGIEYAQQFSNSLVRHPFHGRYDPEDVKYNIIGLAGFSACWIFYLLVSPIFSPVKSIQPNTTSQKGAFHISMDKQQLDIPFIHQYLSTRSYGSTGIPMHALRISIEHSMCFGLYDSTKQIGFARVVTDMTTIAYLGDVFIAKEYMGQGLGKWLIDEILKQPSLQDVRRWIVPAGEEQAFFRHVGFTHFIAPEQWMELYNDKEYGGKAR